MVDSGPESPVFDVAIVGGGLVGASLALALRGTGLGVAVIEAVTPQAGRQPSYDDRTLVLNEVSGRIMRSLGLGRLLDEHGEPITSIHVSDRGRPGRVLLHARDHGRRQFGHVVVARAIGRALLAAIEQAGETGLRWLAPARLERLRIHGKEAILRLDGKLPEIRARLVVGADGADSRVRQLCAMPAAVHDYRQTAIVCNATPERAHQGRAYERFTGHGPLAVLPQAGRRVGVVLCESTPRAEALLGLPDEAFMDELQRRFGYRLGRFEQIGRRGAYPLRLVTAAHPVRERVVLIGNAAHTIHPVSAQGFNLGLRDAWQLAAHLTGCQAAGEDPGALAGLEAYQRGRREDQRRTITYTDTLARLYAGTGPLAGLLRGAGLLAHQFVPGLQRRLVRGAMGYRGDLAPADAGEGP